ncbi:34779_t:CDS:2, partial [Racocetra persica]
MASTSNMQVLTQEATYLIISNSSTTNLRNHVFKIHNIKISETVSSEDFTIAIPQSSEDIFREAL